MALHTELETHKVAEELLGLSLDLVRNIPRDLIASTDGKNSCSSAYGLCE